MSPSHIFAAQELLSAASLGLAAWFYARATRAEKSRRLAASETERMRQWNTFWKQENEALADEVVEARRRTAAGRHARQAQISKQRLKVAATTARIREGLSA